MNKNTYEVNVLVNGKRVKEFNKNGLTLVQGNKGTHYEIEVKNHSYNQVLAVIYVDGNSVMSDNNDDSGYIIDGHDSIRIKGFRTSNETEAEFVFSSKGDSRAQKVKGDARNCGVIGVKIFEEKSAWDDIKIGGFKYPHGVTIDTWTEPYKSSGDVPPPATWGTCDSVYHTTTDCSNINTTSSSSSTYSAGVTLTSNAARSLEMKSAGKFDLGTEMGEDVHSPVVTVTFQKGKLASEFAIHYTSRHQLEQMGVSFKKETKAYVPSAFGSYCKRPK